MTFAIWWPVLYGLVLLGVLVLWVKTDNRKQRPEVGKTRSLLSVLWSLYTHAGKRVGLSGIGHFIRRYRNATAGLG